MAKDLICQEERNPIEGKCLMVYLAKENHGGIDNLRENGWKPRVRHFVIRVYKLVLSIADKIKLGRFLRKIASKFTTRGDWYR